MHMWRYREHWYLKSKDADAKEQPPSSSFTCVVKVCACVGVLCALGRYITQSEGCDTVRNVLRLLPSRTIFANRLVLYTRREYRYITFALAESQNIILFVYYADHARSIKYNSRCAALLRGWMRRLSGLEAEVMPLPLSCARPHVYIIYGKRAVGGYMVVAQRRSICCNFKNNKKKNGSVCK